MRDGVCLSASLYLPPGHAVPGPCLFALTPYTAQRNHARACTFARLGFPTLIVDCRGRGNSEGGFTPFLQEASDGFDVVEWIARQPFCDGKVGMFGASYVGYDQWATAKELPPHLATIIPTAAAAPGIEGNPMRSNVGHLYLLRWLSLIAGRTHQLRVFEDERFWRETYYDFCISGLPYRSLDDFVGFPDHNFQTWVEHPAQDSYWDQFRPSASQYAKMHSPVLTITGAYDADQAGALHYYQEHVRHAPADIAKAHHLIIGPWNHAGAVESTTRIGGLGFGPAAQLDLHALHADWFDWTLRAGKKPSFLIDRVAYYVAGAERWRYASSLEDATEHVEALYLHASDNPDRLANSGALTRNAGQSPPSCYRYDPGDLHFAELERMREEPMTILRPTFPVDDPLDDCRARAINGDGLIFESVPFDSDQEISGFFRLTAWIAIDQPDTDFSVSIFEVTLDGRSILLTCDLMRARYRLGLRAELLIDSMDALRYDFDRFTFISREVKQGSKLRLLICSPNSIYVQRNYNSSKPVAEQSRADARTVTVRLFHDTAHPSVLYVPIGRSDG